LPARLPENKLQSKANEVKGSGTALSLPFYANAMMKRYNTFNEELRRRFGCRVQRVSLDAGFSCPNRDGSLASGGCTFLW